MYRLEDHYNWRVLRHWRIALETGNVGRKTIGTGKITNDLLGNAIKLLKDDCFPVSIICYCTVKNRKEIWMTPLWTGIFGFLDNQEYFEMAGEKIFFQDMTDTDQKAILNAQIASMWVSGD